MKLKNRVATGALAALIVLAAPTASAVERKGFVIGFGAGVGQSRVEGSGNTAFGSSFSIGGMVGQKTALLLDATSVTDSEEDILVGIGVSGVAAQRWLTDRVWVKAGIGSGVLFASGNGESEQENLGFGISTGIGYEVVQKKKFTLDLQGRFTTSSKDGVRVNNYIGLVGFNWY